MLKFVSAVIHEVKLVFDVAGIPFRSGDVMFMPINGSRRDGHFNQTVLVTINKDYPGSMLVDATYLGWAEEIEKFGKCWNCDDYNALYTIIDIEDDRDVPPAFCLKCLIEMLENRLVGRKKGLFQARKSRYVEKI